MYLYLYIVKSFWHCVLQKHVVSWKEQKVWAPMFYVTLSLLEIHHQPSVIRRYQLNKMVVDTNAGPHGNRTVLFLGSSHGTILKFLIVPNRDNTVSNNNIFLEELEGFNPEK